jgi:hypothetical protein
MATTVEDLQVQHQHAERENVEQNPEIEQRNLGLPSLNFRYQGLDLRFQSLDWKFDADQAY